ncbi:hypothetical protein HYG81_18915 [Natrinema zhouii]|nr:hypothetical protein [Natrinema zhouii]UHQ97935.1 hypothetical protein HYG81_18915 [Natrinema zhouii]
MDVAKGGFDGSGSGWWLCLGVVSVPVGDRGREGSDGDNLERLEPACCGSRPRQRREVAPDGLLAVYMVA